jgi:hypothetical protein
VQFCYVFALPLLEELMHILCYYSSQYYTRFKSYCCEAYNILRKSSSLILNLFKLMERSGIPDISSDESGGLKVSWQSRDKSACELCKKITDMLLPVSVIHWPISFRRSSDWIWMMRRLYISSRILSTKVSALYSLKWLRPSIGGLNIGDKLSTF